MSNPTPTYEEAKKLHMSLGRQIDLLNKDCATIQTVLNLKQQKLGQMVTKHRELGMLLFEQEGKIQVLKPKKSCNRRPKKKDPQQMTVTELSAHIKNMPESERVRFVGDFLLQK